LAKWNKANAAKKAVTQQNAKVKKAQQEAVKQRNARRKKARQEEAKRENDIVEKRIKARIADRPFISHDSYPQRNIHTLQNPYIHGIQMELLKRQD
jgi:hypothetical protein